MAQQVELAATPRSVLGKANKRLRKAGILPANISGHKESSQAIQFSVVEFERLKREHAATRIISIKLPNAERQTALIRQVQHEPKTGKVIHVDFSRVSLNERITVNIPLHFVG